MKAAARSAGVPLRTILASLALLAGVHAASARTLQAIRERGTISLCAHPNSLPFASRSEQPAGFQIELGRALADRLGVSLTVEWVLISYQIPRTDCDIIPDTIAVDDAPPDFGIRLSKPYYRSGVILAVPAGSAIASFHDLGRGTKVAVQTGSLAAMSIDRRHVPISVFGFEDDMLAALAAHEVDAAAVTPLFAGYYNHRHADQPVTLLPLDEAEHDLVWNVAIGMRRPDDALRQAIDQAIERLSADGTIAGIYRRYGIVLQPPR
ncbi:MAG TPA: transporter substrate-binding domain-containing protein [Acetobacteraceae bacterium]|jgi:polar amino acid transport system substrate-binding protein|nr:transporter substrate-binding domain-containing protein [Acetobacteraceae bacterium]